MKRLKILFLIFMLHSANIIAQEYWGSKYEVMDMNGAGETYESVMTLDTNNERLAFRFTVPSTKGNIIVDNVRLYFELAGGSPIFQFRIETVDANGNPSGNLVDPNATADYGPGSTGSKTVNFAGAFILSAGTTYCIVIDPNGHASASSYYDFRVSSPLNNLICDGSDEEYSDNSLNVLFSTNNGTNWVVKNYSPVFALGSSGTYVLGTSYNSKQNININSSTIKVGEVFVAPRTMTFDRVAIYASKSGSPPPLQYKIDRVNGIDDLTVISNLNSGQFGGYPYGWIEASTGGNITLHSNYVYLFSFFSPGADGGNYFKIPGLKGWDSSFTWYGANGYAVVDSGGGWSDFYTTKRGDIAFKVGLVGGGAGNNPPNAFNLISPTNNQVVSNLKPTFVWHKADDPDGDTVSYELDIDTGTDFGSDTIVYKDISTTNFTISINLETNTYYYWRVIASDGSAQRVSANTNRFIIISSGGTVNYPPDAFDLISPLNQTVTVSTPTFIWHKTADPEDGTNVNYTLLISPTNNFETGVITYSKLYVTNFTIQDKLRNKITYYWKVIANDTQGAETTSSSIGSFNVNYKETISVEKPTPREKTYLYEPVPNIFDCDEQAKLDIIFDVHEAGNVTIDIYNLNGERVAGILQANLYSGRYKVSWGGAIGEFNATAVEANETSNPVGMSGNKVGRGVYIIVLKTEDKIEKRKLFIK